MPPNEPAPTAPFTEEGRAILARLAIYAEELRPAFAYITHLEGALEAARAVPDVDRHEDPKTGINYVSPRDPRTVLAETRGALARAALPTSKGGE